MKVKNARELFGKSGNRKTEFRNQSVSFINHEKMCSWIEAEIGGLLGLFTPLPPPLESWG